MAPRARPRVAQDPLQPQEPEPLPPPNARPPLSRWSTGRCSFNSVRSAAWACGAGPGPVASAAAPFPPPVRVSGEWVTEGGGRPHHTSLAPTSCSLFSGVEAAGVSGERTGARCRGSGAQQVGLEAAGPGLRAHGPGVGAHAQGTGVGGL
jgi:hypothetical protein